jgi:uncharacterized membrane protein YphA (DoxX/SURF4 family)
MEVALMDAARWSSFVGLMARRVYLPLRLGIGVLLLYAGISKLFEPLAFYQAVLQYRLLSGGASVFAAAVLPWVEVVVGAALLLDQCPLGAWLSGALLFGTFTTARALAVLKHATVASGCGAIPESVSSWDAVGLVAALGIAAVVGLWVAMSRCARG